MASKIYDEISTATKFKWDADADVAVNVTALAKSTDSMTDAGYAKLSKAAGDYLDAIAAAMEKGEAPPEFPDYVENAAPEEPKPDAAPRRRRRKPAETAPPATTADAPAETATDSTDTGEVPDAPAAKKATKRRSRKKASAKTAETTTTTEAAEPGSTSPARPAKRGDKMSALRQLSLDNQEMTNPQLFDLATAAGLEPTMATTVLVHYNTRHTIRHLEEMGYYDHGKRMADLAAAESAAESDSSSEG